MSLDDITPAEWDMMARNRPLGWVPKEQSDGSTASYYEKNG